MADSTFKMEASAATQDVHSTWEGPAARVPFVDEPRVRVAKPRPTAPAPDPFRLGFRPGQRTATDRVGQAPLSAEDLLYPQEGDVVSDGYHHNSLLQPEADSLRRHLEKRGDTLVTGSTAASRWLAAGFVLASA